MNPRAINKILNFNKLYSTENNTEKTTNKGDLHMSNTNKHTPAPWRVHDEKTSFGRIVYVQTDMGENICDLYYKNKNEIIQFNDMEANACLIAAAPELLEALECLVEATIESEGTHRAAGRPGEEKEIKQARCLALSTIKKAKPQVRKNEDLLKGEG